MTKKFVLIDADVRYFIENIKSDHPSFAYERWSQLINLVTMEYYSTSQISFVSSSSMKL